MHQVRLLGSTPFAHNVAYDSGRCELTEQDFLVYATEGYLVLRRLVPPATLVALREEILLSFGPINVPYIDNAWLTSNALLDLFTFGPFGDIAAQLFHKGGGSKQAHLLYSVHHVRPGSMLPRFGDYHVDVVECEEAYLPAAETLRTKVKFWVGLYDDVPAMWFLNQSTFELILKRTNDTLLSDFAAGTLSPWWAWGMSVENPEVMDALVLKPRLRLGDAIVHSPCLVHRSPVAVAGVPTGFLAPSYAAPEARYVGESARQCDSGVGRGTRLADAPSITGVPRPSCYPQVYPLEAARGRAELRASFREWPRWTGVTPLDWWLEAWLMSLQHAWRGAYGASVDSRAGSPAATTGAATASCMLAPRGHGQAAGN